MLEVRGDHLGINCPELVVIPKASPVTVTCLVFVGTRRPPRTDDARSNRDHGIPESRTIVVSRGASLVLTDSIAAPIEPDPSPKGTGSTGVDHGLTAT
jgi:hypothetical protein